MLYTVAITYAYSHINGLFIIVISDVIVVSVVI